MSQDQRNSIRRVLRFFLSGVSAISWIFVGGWSAWGQNRGNPDLPFRPIGSPSAVDRPQIAPPSGTPGGVRQVAMQSGGFTFPGTPLPENVTPQNSIAPPSLPQRSSNPVPLQTVPQQNLPFQNQVPMNQVPMNQAPVTRTPMTGYGPNQNLPFENGQRTNAAPPRNLPMADHAPLAPPELRNGGYATMGDCRLITPPSNYASMSPYNGGCGYAVAPVGYAPSVYTPPPAQVVTPAVMPPMASNPNAAPQITSPASAAPVGSLVTLGQQNYPVQLGQGLWGQPKAYVPGQPIRNWLRYFSF